MNHTWTQYRRKGLSEMRPYTPGETLESKVSISEADRLNGSPKPGDMIARNPKNPEDQWLVAEKYFRDNLELARQPGGKNLPFGEAIEALKSGKRVARSGWNGRGMYLWLLPEAYVKAEWCREPHLKAVAEANGGEIPCLGSVRMFTVNASGHRAVLTGWLASQTDMLSEDWQILD